MDHGRHFWTGRYEMSTVLQNLTCEKRWAEAEVTMKQNLTFQRPFEFETICLNWAFITFLQYKVWIKIIWNILSLSRELTPKILDINGSLELISQFAIRAICSPPGNYITSYTWECDITQCSYNANITSSLGQIESNVTPKINVILRQFNPFTRRWGPYLGALWKVVYRLLWGSSCHLFVECRKLTACSPWSHHMIDPQNKCTLILIWPNKYIFFGHRFGLHVRNVKRSRDWILSFDSKPFSNYDSF